MHIVHLSLTNFRNYGWLELDIPPSISVFIGANAQGKTNLLESICFLSTNRFSRTIAEKDIVNRASLEEKMPFSRASADILKGERDIQVEIIMRPRSIAQLGNTAVPAPFQKYIRVNGINRRAIDLIGQLNMVMFSPRDIDLTSGNPALRRRYLDITNSQVDPQYLRSLQRYGKILSQRNHLLRQLAAHRSRSDELSFWDHELVTAGSYIILQRQRSISNLNALANPIHEQLSGGQESLALQYRRRIDSEVSEFENIDNVEQSFTTALNATRDKELSCGVSLVGPHRDDFEFLINEVNMGSYGSRGQQRTIALSLKLAEVKFMLTQTGETPVLLLDDVLSELDSQRRQHLLDAITEYQQVLITTTDLDRFPSDFLSRAEKFTVEDGKIDTAN